MFRLALVQHTYSLPSIVTCITLYYIIVILAQGELVHGFTRSSVIASKVQLLASG